MTALFLIVYLVIALACVGLGLYLSQPGKSYATLKDDALSVFHRRSRPAPVDLWPTSMPVQHDEPATPVDEHNADTQYHLATPVIPPIIDERHGEPEPAEAVHDEP